MKVSNWGTGWVHVHPSRITISDVFCVWSILTCFFVRKVCEDSKWTCIGLIDLCVATFVFSDNFFYLPSFVNVRDREHWSPGPRWFETTRRRRIIVASTKARFHRNCLTASNRNHSRFVVKSYPTVWMAINCNFLRLLNSTCCVFVTSHSSPLKCWKDLLNERK